MSVSPAEPPGFSCYYTTDYPAVLGTDVAVILVVVKSVFVRVSISKYFGRYVRAIILHVSRCSRYLLIEQKNYTGIAGPAGERTNS